jgi:hypothetical protein
MTTEQKPPVYIRTAAQLVEAARTKRSVVTPFGRDGRKVLPAAFVASMQFRIVAGWLGSGLLTLYEKPPRVRAKFPRMGKQAAEKPPSNKEIAG